MCRYGIHAHNNAIFDLTWMFDQMKLVTASGDHTSKLYSIENGEIREERVFCGHTRSVKTVAFRKDDSSVFASGGRDGNIILWDTRTNASSFVGKIDRTIHNSHTARTFTPSKNRKKFGTPTGSSVKSVTGLVFQDQNTLISCGAGDGIIKIWDLRKNYVTYKKEAMPKSLILYPGNTTKNGYSNLIIDNEGVRLYANCLDNTIYCYNMCTYNNEPVMKYVGHQNNTFYVKSSLCKNGMYLVSGSSDENAYIWNTKYSHPLVKLTGHTAEVTSVAWSDKNVMLITCSDDMTHKIWTVGPDNLPENWELVGKGLAEVIPIMENSSIKVKLKRPIILETVTDHHTPKKICLECKRCNNTSSTRFCENCNVSSKRKSSYELTNENKRVQTEFGPRRLFANVNNIVSEESETLAESLDQEEGKIYKEDWEPPRKIPKLLSPSTSKNETVLSSPTINLPNYVVDGIAPHINYSPPKKKDCDWLTKIRIEKNIRREMIDRTLRPSTPKVSKFDLPPATSRCSSPKSPLLRFFKVTNNSQKCDGINCSKPHSCTNFTKVHPN